MGNASRGRRPAPPPATSAAAVAYTENGWTFLLWPDFAARWTALLRVVLQQRSASPAGVPLALSEATMLAALVRLIRDHIARDPNAAAFRLSGSLGAWRRVKFLGRFRLFYRFSSAHKIVVLTWLNDENTLRKTGAVTDPYYVFSSMLSRGEVPADWAALVVGATPLPTPLPHP